MQRALKGTYPFNDEPVSHARSEVADNKSACASLGTAGEKPHTNGECQYQPIIFLGGRAKCKHASHLHKWAEVQKHTCAHIQDPGGDHRRYIVKWSSGYRISMALVAPPHAWPGVRCMLFAHKQQTRV